MTILSEHRGRTADDAIAEFLAARFSLPQFRAWEWVDQANGVFKPAFGRIHYTVQYDRLTRTYLFRVHPRRAATIAKTNGSAGSDSHE